MVLKTRTLTNGPQSGKNSYVRMWIGAHFYSKFFCASPLLFEEKAIYKNTELCYVIITWTVGLTNSRNKICNAYYHLLIYVMLTFELIMASLCDIMGTCFFYKHEARFIFKKIHIQLL